MTTQIVHGNPSPISEMQRMLSKISTTFTPPFHLPSPLIQQTSFCYSKSSQSRLLNFTHAAFLSITWKLIFRRGVVLWSHSLGLHFNGLSQFFSSETLLKRLALQVISKDCLDHLESEGKGLSLLQRETPRESDWGCQSIPWPLYTIILYVHVGIESTGIVQGRHNRD